MRIFISILIALLLVGCTGQSPVADDRADVAEASSLPSSGSFVLISEQSVLRYSASKVVGVPHTGTVAIKEGSIDFDKGGTGTFIIDMGSITEDKDNKAFLDHIRSADFFDVAKYPESVLAIKDISSGFIVTADLTILGKTEEVSFPASLTEADGVFKVTADFTIDRTRWGLTYGSGSFFKELGDKAIKDDIGFGLDLRFRKA